MTRETKTKKQKGRLLNALVFEKPNVSFWVSTTNIIAFYISNLLTIVNDDTNREKNINNALRSVTAFKKNIKLFYRKIGTVLREELNAFLIEAAEINKILKRYTAVSGAFNEEDIQELYAKVFKVQYLHSCLQKSFRRFVQQKS